MAAENQDAAATRLQAAARGRALRRANVRWSRALGFARSWGGVWRSLQRASCLNDAADGADASSGSKYLSMLRVGTMSRLPAQAVLCRVRADASAAKAAQQMHDDASVVLETEQGERVAYHLQADEAVNTREAFAQRAALRTDPTVVKGLHRFWLVAQLSVRRPELCDVAGETQGDGLAVKVRAAGAGASGEPPALSKEEAADVLAIESLDEGGYAMMMRRVYRVLLEEWDEDDAAAAIAEDYLERHQRHTRAPNAHPLPARAVLGAQGTAAIAALRVRQADTHGEPALDRQVHLPCISRASPVHLPASHLHLL